jgi:hypothetical protein
MKNLFYLALALSLAGCTLFDPEPLQPAYIYVQPYQMQANPAISHGSLSELIVASYVFVGDENLGIFTLPARIPVLAAEGELPIVMDPLIRENGSVFTLGAYPFYSRWEGVVKLDYTKTDTVQPVTSYRSNITVAFVEDFETGFRVFTDKVDGDSVTRIEASTLDVYEGTRSGHIRLTMENPILEIATTADNLFDLRRSNACYLELNVKTDTEFMIGLIGNDNLGQSGKNYEFGVLPRNEWTKIYFNMTEQVRVSQFDSYQIALRALLPAAFGFGDQQEGNIFLDNIKLIYF